MLHNIKTFTPKILQHKCKRCKSVILESGNIRDPHIKEVRANGIWRKGEIWVNQIKHPLFHDRIIALLYHCICKVCGEQNCFNIATGGKFGVKLEYDHLKTEQGRMIV